MNRSVTMISAWVQAMEDAQPQYGVLLESTVDKVGYPAIDQDGVIRTIRDNMAYWGACGYMQGFARTRVERMYYRVMGDEYPKLQAASDEEGMVLALAKGEFFETFTQWIKSTEPQKLPMKETPVWLLPFMNSDD
jgi:hypothetical protein